MQRKLVCVTCGTTTDDGSCSHCGERHNLSTKLTWLQLDEPFADLYALLPMGWYPHFSSVDRLQGNIYPWKPPTSIPWFSKANQHLWYAAGKWFMGTWQNKTLEDIEHNTDLFTLLNNYKHGTETES